MNRFEFAQAVLPEDESVVHRDLQNIKIYDGNDKVCQKRMNLLNISKY